MRRFFLTVVAAAFGAGVMYWVMQEPETTARLWAYFDALRTNTPTRGMKAKKSAQRSVTVEAVAARQATTTKDIRGIGSLRSDEAVQIASEITGRVAAVQFNEGEAVKAGDVLVKLDDQLAQAELADANARFGLAEANFERAKALSRTGNVTGKARDEATANLEIARAAVELARVRLSKHAITAPFSGRIGIRLISPGAYVAIGTPMVNLEKIDVLKLDFKLPENLLGHVRVGQSVEITVDALADRKFIGKVYAINPLVDVNGRALHLRALIDNHDFVLRPGLFARVVLKGLQAREVVLVPESAIVPRAGESFVYKVENGKAVETAVKLGERKNGEVEVIEGLLPEAVVVVAGQQKLRDGSDVEIVESRDETTAAEPARKGS
jgi:membrane fusion protein (multidrug efflux system)